MPISIPYPQIVQLEDGNQIELTNDTWEKRLLVIETDKTEQEIRAIFKKEGFKEETLEFFKNGQLGSGLSKKIQDWQVHVRLFPHDKHIQIDGEVEVSKDYVEHLTHGWISAFKETWNIVLRYFRHLWVYHKGLGKYVTRVIKEGILTLPEPKTKTDVAILIGAGVAGALIGTIIILALKK